MDLKCILEIEIRLKSFQIMKLKAIAEKTKDGFSGYFPELPGCISIGDNIEDLKINLKEAAELYIEELRKLFCRGKLLWFK